MDKEIKRLLIELVVGLVGFGLFAYACGWLATLAIFIILFGNNLSQGGVIKREIFKTLADSLQEAQQRINKPMDFPDIGGVERQNNEETENDEE